MPFVSLLGSWSRSTGSLKRGFLRGGVCVTGVFWFDLGSSLYLRLTKTCPDSSCSKRTGVGDADEIQYHLQYLSIVLDVVLRLGKLAQLIDMGFEITQKFLILLHQKLDSIERFRLDLKIVVDL